MVSAFKTGSQIVPEGYPITRYYTSGHDRVSAMLPYLSAHYRVILYMASGHNALVIEAFLVDMARYGI